jgi:hypothetical protein
VINWDRHINTQERCSHKHSFPCEICPMFCMSVNLTFFTVTKNRYWGHLWTERWKEYSGLREVMYWENGENFITESVTHYTFHVETENRVKVKAKVKLKLKLSLCFNWAPLHGGVLRSGGNRWSWAISFTPRPLYLQGKSHQYPLDRRWE